MIQPLKNFPGQVVAFHCSGRVTRLEYDSVLIPTVEAAFDKHHKLRLYYETARDFSVEPGALWEDLKLSIEHITRSERLAIVTDVDWIRHTMRAFSFLLPGRLKLFRASELVQAREWIIAEMPKAR